jgi:hypothetical protein
MMVGAGVVDDDDNTYEEGTYTGTLEGTIEGTLATSYDVEVAPAFLGIVAGSSTEKMILNAATAMALAVARTQPVTVSPSMAFSNALDMDNLCRVRTEDTTYSTIYQLAGSRHRGSGRYRHSSSSSIDYDEESMTLKSLNTLHSGRQSFDEDSQQEEEGLIPVFAMNFEENFKNSNNNASSILNNLERDDEQSYDTRDPPSAEQLVLNGNDLDTNENGGEFVHPKKASSWFPTMKGKKEETNLTLQYQREHVEIVVNDHKTDEKKKFKRVRFWTPKVHKNITKILHPGKVDADPQPQRQQKSDSDDIKDELVSLGVILQVSSVSVKSRVTNRSPDSSNVSSNSIEGDDCPTVPDESCHQDEKSGSRSAASSGRYSIATGDDGSAQSSITDKSSQSTCFSSEDNSKTEGGDDVASVTFQPGSELIRNSSDENGFEVEMTTIQITSVPLSESTRSSVTSEDLNNLSSDQQKDNKVREAKAPPPELNLVTGSENGCNRSDDDGDETLEIRGSYTDDDQRETEYNNKEEPNFVPILVTKSTFEDADCDEEQVATYIVSSSSARGGKLVCVNGSGCFSRRDGDSNEPGFEVFEILVLPIPGYGRHVEV